MKYIVKKSTFLSLVLLVVLIVGCGQHNKENSEAMVRLAHLTEDQSRLVSLLSDTSGLTIYDVYPQDKYNVMTVWTEVYEEGQMINGISENTFSLTNTYGNLSIQYEGGQEIDIAYGQGKSTFKVNVLLPYDFMTDEGIGLASASLSDEVLIEEDAEIVLKALVFDPSAKGVSLYSMEEYTSGSQVLGDYSNLVLIKCKFQKK